MNWDGDCLKFLGRNLMGDEWDISQLYIEMIVGEGESLKGNQIDLEPELVGNG